MTVIWQSGQHLCLECGKEYTNELNIAVCHDCLEKERKKHQTGKKSEYETVNMFLEQENPA